MQNKLSLRQKLGLIVMGLKAKDNMMPGMLVPSKYYYPIWKDWNTGVAIREGFKSSVYVYAGIYRIMKSAASVPWITKEPSKDPKSKEEYDIVKGHPLTILMSKPNPFMSGQDLVERITSHLYLGGNAILYKNKIRREGKDITAELWPIMPDTITPVPDKVNFIKYYKYRLGSVVKDLDPASIIHVMFTDPGDMFWGMSPLQAAGRIIDTDVEATKWNKIALQNRAVTDGVFSFEHSITKKQWREAREMIREQHQGSESARMPWILGSGAKWNQMSLSPVDMDYIEGKKMNREDICAILNMPPPMVSIYDNATLANIETARKIMWVDTIVPYLDDLKSIFALSLVPEFGEDLIFEYDTSNVQALQEDFGKKIESGYKLWQMGVPFNMINQKLKLGIDDVPEGDVGYVPATLIPTGYTGLGEKAYGEFEMKPYPNEHSARLKDPDMEHIRVRRTSGSGKGTVQGVKVPTSIDIIWYIIKKDNKEIPIAQALRFPIKKWTEKEARKWLKDNEIKYINFEPASKDWTLNIVNKESAKDDGGGGSKTLTIEELNKYFKLDDSIKKKSIR